jgi:hypothetical protein
MKMNKTAHIIGSICRTLLGITFIFSGFVKAVDPLGTVYKIEDYLMAFGGWFTDLMPLAGTAAVILIAMEWTLGVCMLFNVRTSITSWLSLAFYLVMTPLTLWIALTNPVSDCGCFGDAIVLTNWQTFWKNVVLLILVIVLLGCKRFIPQLLSWWGELVVLLIAFGASAAVMTYSYTHLPPMDFRPYKVGNHIPTLMEVPEGAPVDEYQITLIYEKDGVEQEFTLENYPKGDDSWTFVDQRSVLIKKGYEAPIHDFEILTMNFEDITYDIIESEQAITLITMYDLDKTNRTQAAKLMGIYNACMERGELCYFLTGSGEEQIYAFGEEIGMDMETIESTFCTIDPVTLKTIVRANPGMFVVQNGTILEKHNLKQLNQYK